MSMAYELGLRKATFIVSAELEDEQYYGVVMNSSEKIVLASEGVKILGVLQDAPDAANRSCIVAFGGITKAIGAEAIAAGAEVQVDGDGKFINVGTGVGIGTAVVACGGDGQQFSLLFNQT